MNKIVYRLATSNDIDQLVKLRVLMQKEVHQATDDNVDSDYLTGVEKYFKRTINAGSYYSAVAEINGELVAATGLVVYEKPPSLKGRSGRVGYITNVYTLPEYRKQGIASKLMELTANQAKKDGVDKLHLWSTDDGKGVYERVGFTPIKLASLELKFQ
jgi:GNAT superfamily N-acetyltransferase